MRIGLIAVCILLFGVSSSIAQFNANCSGCIIDSGCQTPDPNGGICNPNLTPVTVGQYYDYDISVYMNATPSQGGVTVSLDEISYDSYSGLPAGLNITLSTHPVNKFYPSSNPPASEYGCYKICGTTYAAPGLYTVTINQTAIVSQTPIPVGPQSNQTQFDIEVLPPSGGNSGFTFFPASGCDSINVDFETQVASPDPILNPFEYDWDFGNGQTDTGITANGIDYNQVGSYTPELVITTYQYVITEVTVTQNNGNWYYQESAGDGIGIPGLGFTKVSDPDLVFDFTNGNNVYTSSEKTNELTPSWTGLNIVLESQAMSISFTDVDLLNSDFGGVTSFFFQGQEGTFVMGLSPSNMTFEIVIEKQPANVLTYTDSAAIKVNSTPQISELFNDNNDTVCRGEEVILFTDLDTSNYSFRWFLNDTTLINLATDSFLNVTQNGAYSVEVTSNSGGCRIVSPSRQIKFITLPSTPKLFVSTDYSSVFTTNNYGVDSLQWYYNGIPVPSPVGNDDILQFLGLGVYQLEFLNLNGLCKTLSDSLVIDSIPDGINNPFQYDAFNLFPNPASNVAYIQLNANLISKSEILYITVSNIASNVLKRIDVYNTDIIEIDLNNLSNGVYFINLTTQNGSYCEKLIVMK